MTTAAAPTSWRAEKPLLHSYVRAHAEVRPDAEAIIHAKGRTTFTQLLRDAEAMAAALEGLGVRPGDTVSYQLPNWIETFVVVLATLRIGAIANPVVPIYRGTSQLKPDLLAGRAHANFDAPVTAAPDVAAGKVVPLAVTSTERSSALPEVPTMAEAGLPEVMMLTWFGILASGRIDPQLRDRLNNDLNAVLRDADFIQWCNGRGIRPRPGTAADFERFMAQETERLGRLIRSANIRAE